MFNLDFVGKQVKEYFDQNKIDRDVWKDENLSEFSNRAGYAVSLILQEKEILLFSALQWAVIGLVYYLWAQILGWIPPEVWESKSKIYDLPLNLAFLAWGFLCVTLAAYPIGVLTGAMGAAHFLRAQGHRSTIAACLQLALRNSGKLWAFHTADSWFTVQMILERLPKRGYISGAAQRAIKETLYYAWKVGTIGVGPALLTGAGLIEAGKESVSLVKRRLWDAIKLRGGYAITCWIVGIAAYLGSIFFFYHNHAVFIKSHTIYTFYFWMGIPLLVAVGVVSLFIRPIFVIASCKLYSDYLKDIKRPVHFADLPGSAAGVFVAFLVLCTLLAAIYLYREQIGLMVILRVATG